MEKQEIIKYLRGENDDKLFERSESIKLSSVGSKVYLRGLIELSNICRKDCYYCGIRLSNRSIERYELTRDQVMDSVRFAIDRNYGSVVIQAGEQISSTYVDFVEELLREITVLGEGKLGITISLGEQSEDTYRRWRKAGAHRYLLRIESFTEDLYSKLHPASHSWSERMECIRALRKLDYQVGTGVMIGVPHQTIEHLADDLLGLVDLDVDMCGMGPYVEHSKAPLSSIPSKFTPKERVELTLRMVALLRILMPDINIASTTALDAINPGARAKCLEIGANIIMPNISPSELRSQYQLYHNKPTVDFELSSYEIAYLEQGNSKRYINR